MAQESLTDVTVSETTLLSETGYSPMREAWRMFLRNKAAVLGLILFAIVLLFSLIGPFIYTIDPSKIVWAPFSLPGENETVALGTDHLGRDLLAGLIDGGDTTLLVGVTAAALTVFIGILVGALAGYYGGWVDEALMRVTEFFQVLPALLFAMVIVALWGPKPTVDLADWFPRIANWLPFTMPVITVSTIPIAIGLVLWPQTARLTRGEFLKIKNLEYVSAARAIGTSDASIIRDVILPNAAPPLIVSATLVVGVAILFEAGLSFLGLGDPNVISWGLMLGQGRAYLLTGGWWLVTLPGVAIFLTVLSISLIGDGLNDAFNPKLRER